MEISNKIHSTLSEKAAANFKKDGQPQYYIRQFNSHSRAIPARVSPAMIPASASGNSSNEDGGDANLSNRRPLYTLGHKFFKNPAIEEEDEDPENRLTLKSVSEYCLNRKFNADNVSMHSVNIAKKPTEIGAYKGRGNGSGIRTPSLSVHTGLDHNDVDMTRVRRHQRSLQQQQMSAESILSRSLSPNLTPELKKYKSFSRVVSTSTPQQMDSTYSPYSDSTLRRTNRSQSYLVSNGEVIGYTPTHMNFIILIGYLLGWFISYLINLVCRYFDSIRLQSLKLRSQFMGNCNFFQFFNFRDNSRFSVKTKLLIMPIVLVCSLFNAVLNIMIFGGQLLLKKVPNCVVEQLQRYCNRF